MGPFSDRFDTAGSGGGTLNSGMSIQAVSLDCAHTLIDVNWNPPVFAVQCLDHLGIEVDRQVAAEIYGRKLVTQWPHYQQLNIHASEEELDCFWKDLTREWLDVLSLGERFSEVVGVVNELLYGDQGVVYQIYEDTVPALIRLRDRGLKLAVTSNWDYTLERVLVRYGIREYFDVVIPSLRLGVEKPEPGIFQELLVRLDLPQTAVLHVGDNILDDFQGAKNLGLSALHLDRGLDQRDGHRISKLTEIPEALGWT